MSKNIISALLVNRKYQAIFMWSFVLLAVIIALSIKQNVGSFIGCTVLGKSII